MSEQWCPFATRRIGAMGLTAKHGYPGGIQGVPADNLMTAPKKGEVKHDSTGPLAPTLGVLDTHPINSWHFTVDDSGIYQHYPVDANCWHGNDTDPDDDIRANVDLVGVEHTCPVFGVPTPLSARQLMLTTQLSQWLMETRGYKTATRFSAFFDHQAWLECEHNEVGNTPTACPSDRIPWGLIMPELDGAPTPRTWVYGNEVAGCEQRGEQLFYWHNGVEVDALGDYEGKLPGAHYHHAGQNADGTDRWVEVMK